jgi:hypothetical protein
MLLAMFKSSPLWHIIKLPSRLQIGDVVQRDSTPMSIVTKRPVRSCVLVLINLRYHTLSTKQSRGPSDVGCMSNPPGLNVDKQWT